MPELPDVTVYVERLRGCVLGQTLEDVTLASPFVLRSVEPPLDALLGMPVRAVERLGKRIVFGFPDEYYLVIHLMIAGRLRWRKRETKPPRRNGLAAFHFSSGALVFTEASKRKRASLHVVSGCDQLAGFDRGGLEVLETTSEDFMNRLTVRNHTLKRALTDPTIFSGIGNAYSDEILFRASLSPFRQTQQLAQDEIERLFEACRHTLLEWTERLRTEIGEGFPDKVTAFRPEMAVHGKYREPCPACGSPIQRIVYAENEANYCATCQTGGRLLADRSLSRLLKKNWPKTIEELEGG